jgi:hypothetical protein
VVSYLKRALDEGYKDISKIYSDPNFASVLGDPNMQELLSSIPPAQNQAAVPAAQ